jgi:hypothetical protein
MPLASIMNRITKKLLSHFCPIATGKKQDLVGKAWRRTGIKSKVVKETHT